MIRITDHGRTDLAVAGAALIASAAGAVLLASVTVGHYSPAADHAGAAPANGVAGYSTPPAASPAQSAAGPLVIKAARNKLSTPAADAVLNGLPGSVENTGQPADAGSTTQLFPATADPTRSAIQPGGQDAATGSGNRGPSSGGSNPVSGGGTVTPPGGNASSPGTGSPGAGSSGASAGAQSGGSALTGPAGGPTSVPSGPAAPGSPGGAGLLPTSPATSDPVRPSGGAVDVSPAISAPVSDSPSDPAPVPAENSSPVSDPVSSSPDPAPAVSVPDPIPVSPPVSVPDVAVSASVPEGALP